MMIETRALAVRCESGRGLLNRIRREKGMALFATPRQLEVPGATVAVVQDDGVVSLLFACKRIEELDYGCWLDADARTIRAPSGSDPRRLSIKWRAIGQFRYYSPVTHAPLNLSGAWREPGAEYLDDRIPPLPNPGYQPYGGGIPGRTKRDPESQLVDAYVNWMREPDRFRHQWIDTVGLYTDLIDRRYWRLFEAKVLVDRRTLREAVGQLLDYRRFFRRSPSLGVLLPKRPSFLELEYLDYCRVTAVWMTPAGRFGDSTGSNRWSLRDV